MVDDPVVSEREIVCFAPYEILNGFLEVGNGGLTASWVEMKGAETDVLFKV
jgi:hypothetical protein